MSALLNRLLSVFGKRSRPSVAPTALLTPERISERLHTRRIKPHSPKGVALAESANVVVAEEPSLPSPDHEFAIADTLDHGAQRFIDEPWPEAEPYVANATDTTAAQDTDFPAPIITSEPEPTLVSAEETTRADKEDELLSVEASAEQPVAEHPPVQPTSKAQPSAEILAEFHAVMRRHFDRGEATTDDARNDVFKILKLDAGEPIMTDISVPVPEPGDTLASVPAKPEIEIPAPTTASDPGPAVIALEHVSIDVENDAASTAWRERSVADVILEGDCSVRLSNCIDGNQDFFSDWTIGEALERRSQFTTALMHVRSLGRKTANEALDAIDAFALAPRRKEEMPAEVEQSVVVDPLFGLVPAKLNAPLSEVLGGQNVSVRLANVAASGQLDGLTVRDFVLDADAVRARLRDCKNAGRKTTEEAVEFLAAYVESLALPDAERVGASRHGRSGQLDGLTVRDFVLDADAVRARLRDCKNAGRKTTEEAVEFLAAYVESLALPDAEHEAPMRTDDTGSERLSTGEWIRQEVASLLPRHVEVLNSRYGLDGGTPQTLQEIAERVHVTRERVRQVEAKALKLLRTDGRSFAAFTRYLTEAREAQWDTLFGSQALLSDDEVSVRSRKLAPWFILAIDIVFEHGIDEYLEANAHKTADGWFRNIDEAEVRQKLDSLLGKLLGAYRTPMPLDTLEEIAPSASSLLSREGDHWAVHDGYIFTGHIGSRARRTARMHTIARKIAQSGIFDIGTLIAEYRLIFPDDDCGSRLFEMQANEAPHLFAPLFDGIWLCLDRNSRQIDRLTAPPFERRQVQETHFTEGSLGDQLVKRLTQFGPERLVDLRTTVAESVNGFLLQNPCFRRVAPGIFGLYTGTSEVLPSLDAHLLEERHCRMYCHARHSGAPQDYYPAWGAAYEMRLSAWAQRHAPPDLYRSLLTVIEPDLWPAAPETIAVFQELRTRDGEWQIGASRRMPLGHRFLDSGQFLSALTHLVVFGWMSWVGVNRTTGTISTSQHAADVLAFFVMSSLVEPEPDWQAPHRPTEFARRLFLEARWERHLHGDESSGAEDVFGRLRSAVFDTPPTVSRGWVDADEFKAAMPAWQSNEIWLGKAFGGGQPRNIAINADDLFESVDWDAAFGS